MMALKDQLQSAMKDAMRAKDKARLGVLRMILSDIKRVEVDERIELDDARVLAVLDKMQKQRRDSISQFEAASRQDLADIEKEELEVIAQFLPAALTDQELDALIEDALAQTGASGMADMGKVMGVLKPQTQGRADMGQVSQKVKARLG
ncbi:GatB/YqeY domain-containing protein [Natronospirillum sp.]|uniref:GatB/YqeY domain-containing protein n=1 Tax=Natronospirillum sp. TaxID=2812955 RepID=UPI0025CCF483|nr:GatB/YqeY domain-containing protein [Natronospirillum sp.]